MFASMMKHKIHNVVRVSAFMMNCKILVFQEHFLSLGKSNPFTAFESNLKSYAKCINIQLILVFQHLSQIFY